MLISSCVADMQTVLVQYISAISQPGESSQWKERMNTGSSGESQKGRECGRTVVLTWDDIFFRLWKKNVTLHLTHHSGCHHISLFWSLPWQWSQWIWGGRASEEVWREDCICLGVRCSRLVTRMNRWYLKPQIHWISKFNISTLCIISTYLQYIK